MLRKNLYFDVKHEYIMILESFEYEYIMILKLFEHEYVMIDIEGALLSVRCVRFRHCSFPCIEKAD